MGHTATMTRRKKPKGARDPDAMTTRAIRMRQEYAEWLDQLAAFNRSTVAGLIDQAVVHYGKSIGFDKPPPER